MKTTLDLPDDLLIEAKSLAVRRKTTLKAIVESALRREIRPSADLDNPDPKRFEIGPFGILRLRRPIGDLPITPDLVRSLQSQLEEEDIRRVVHPVRS